MAAAFRPGSETFRLNILKPTCGVVLLLFTQVGVLLRVQGDGSQITVEPGLIGGEINKILANHKTKHNHPVQYKIGPDPSSIDSCMVSASPDTYLGAYSGSSSFLFLACFNSCFVLQLFISVRY